MKMNRSKSRLVAIVGMCGSGKSVLAGELVNRGWNTLRFGQLTLDEVKRRGLPPLEKHEKEIREELRKTHGMAAFAILNIPKIDELKKLGPVVLDGLYSWSEYKVLKEKYGEDLVVVAVYSPPTLRYARLENRAANHSQDSELVFRSVAKSDAQKRDCAEIENIEKGGPIAMADFTLQNTLDLPYLMEQIKELLKTI
jgi:dephospho-CoA kinase